MPHHCVDQRQTIHAEDKFAATQSLYKGGVKVRLHLRSFVNSAKAVVWLVGSDEFDENSSGRSADVDQRLFDEDVDDLESA